MKSRNLVLILSIAMLICLTIVTAATSTISDGKTDPYYGCVGEGGEVYPGASVYSECCPGLSRMPKAVVLPDGKCWTHNTYICTAFCGDGVCGSLYNCPTGTNCGPSHENECSCPQDCLSICAKEGVKSKIGTPCCSGLVRISNDFPDLRTGECTGGTDDGTMYCTKCGDGVCGPGENKCNCPKDCSTAAYCKDSDGGKNPYVKGTTTNVLATDTDHCVYCTGACRENDPSCEVNCGAVVEYFCASNGYTVTSEVIICENGCKYGACIKDAKGYCGDGICDPITEASHTCPQDCQEKTCAKEGELISFINSGYPTECCAGLTEWPSGMSTYISVADRCFETGRMAGSPVGTCINCGNGVCESIENPCNCPKDCIGKERSTYKTVAEFCDLGYKTYCSNEIARDLPLCKLCEGKEDPRQTCAEICKSRGYAVSQCVSWPVVPGVASGCSENLVDAGPTSDCHVPEGSGGGGKTCCCGKPTCSKDLDENGCKIAGGQYVMACSTTGVCVGSCICPTETCKKEGEIFMDANAQCCSGLTRIMDRIPCPDGMACPQVIQYKCVKACYSNNDCGLHSTDLKSFCEFPTGQCKGPGECRTIGSVSESMACPDIYRPVCGCDGKTYPNDCSRQVAGVSKRHDGDCESPPKPTVMATIICIFEGTQERQTCVAEGGFSCTSISSGSTVQNSCKMEVQGGEGENLAIKSACGGYKSVVLSPPYQYEVKFSCEGRVPTTPTSCEFCSDGTPCGRLNSAGQECTCIDVTGDGRNEACTLSRAYSEERKSTYTLSEFIERIFTWISSSMMKPNFILGK